MRYRAGMVAALLSVAAPAQEAATPPPADTAHRDDAAATDALNAAIRTRLDRTDAQNARVRQMEAEYARDRAAYEAAMRENARAVAQAAQAKAAHDAEMAAYTARWSKAPAAQIVPAPHETVMLAAAPTKRVCRYRTETGSLIHKVRECTTVRENAEARAAAQQALRDRTSGISGCGQPVCNR